MFAAGRSVTEAGRALFGKHLRGMIPIRVDMMWVGGAFHVCLHHEVQPLKRGIVSLTIITGRLALFLSGF